MSAIRVLNLSTQQELTYCGISPEQAVVCADYQSRGNFNTWTYDYSRAQRGPSGRTVSCGDWATTTD